MKLTKETLSVLKTLSTINTNLLIKPGSQLDSISPQKNVIANVKVTETFEKEFGIYDLTEFLGVMSLFTDADVEFGDKVATIKEGKSSIRYFAADASLLVVPSKPVKFPDADVEFNVPSATLSMVIKTAGVLRSTDITVEGDGTDIFLVVADLKNPNANSFKVAVGETSKTFKANLKVDNLKMATGDYDVSLSSKKISRWKSTNQDAVYFVALEANSEFS